MSIKNAAHMVRWYVVFAKTDILSFLYSIDNTYWKGFSNIKANFYHVTFRLVVYFEKTNHLNIGYISKILYFNFLVYLIIKIILECIVKHDYSNCKTFFLSFHTYMPSTLIFSSLLNSNKSGIL